MHLVFGGVQSFLWSNAFFTVKKVTLIYAGIERDCKTSQ